MCLTHTALEQAVKFPSMTVPPGGQEWQRSERVPMQIRASGNLKNVQAYLQHLLVRIEGGP